MKEQAIGKYINIYGVASPSFQTAALTVVLLLAASAGDAAGVVSQPNFTCYTTGNYKTCYVNRQECSTSGNFTAGSQYQANLLNLTAELPASTIANDGFAEMTAGSAPDRVFGLAMCYADRNFTQCQDCLLNVSGHVQQECPFSREAKISRDACVLRYSDLPFFSDADREIVSYASTEASPDPFVRDVAAMSAERWTLMMAGLVPEAASSLVRLANGSKEYTDSQGKAQEIYGLAQCTRDLNASMCSECLKNMVIEINSSRPNNTYGAVKCYSCYAAYSIGEDLGITIPLPPPPPPRRKPPAALIAGVTIGSVVVLIICTGILVSFMRCRCRSKGRQQIREDVTGEEAPEDEFEQQAGPRRFRYGELEAATNFFSEEEKLGEGGFGSVYRGLLKDTNPIHVAVKRVSKSSGQGRKEYNSEVKIISQLRHRNLVQLIGWCHERGELLLVYQLMPNGSLNTHIHSQTNVMSWQLRYDIVLGVGSALVYLHHDSERCILHRDIKPSNIMLDASFTAKLGDFGLARLMDRDRQSHTTALAGTMGYMDPECWLSGRVSTSSDVYSFGVVLLEVACGRRPIVDVSESDEEYATVHLVQWVWEFYGRGRIIEAADARLDGDFDAREMESVLVTGLWCAHPDPSSRPSMRQAINVLRLDAPLQRLPMKMPALTFLSPPATSGTQV